MGTPRRATVGRVQGEPHRQISALGCSKRLKFDISLFDGCPSVAPMLCMLCAPLTPASRFPPTVCLVVPNGPTHKLAADVPIAALLTTLSTHIELYKKHSTT